MNRTAIAAALAAALLLPAAAKADDAPGVFKLPGTDSTIKLYGYVQLDTTFDMSGRDPNVEGDDWATVIPLVPLNKNEEAKAKKGQLYLTARTSRFGIQTSTPTKLGNVGVKLEGDFNGPNLEQGQTYTNSVLFRLRHAYGTVGNLLVGQTWTTFLDFGGAPDTVDFNGPGSLALVRNPMIRYTIPLGDGMSLALAAENAPGTDGNDYGGSRTAKYQTIPDFHANFGMSGGWGSASLRAVTSQQKAAKDPESGFSGNYTKQGFGLAASGGFKVAGSDTLVAQVVYGQGIGRYLLNVIADGNRAGAVVDTGDKFYNIPAFAYHAGYTHVWGPEYRSNLIWSQTMITSPKINGVSVFDHTGNNKTMSQLFVNTFWTFAKNAELGVEYVWGQRKDFNGDKGDQNRINATVHYSFF
jgi:hypothetical protein